METVYLFGDNEDNRKIYDGIGERSGVIISETSSMFLASTIEEIVYDVLTMKAKTIVVVNTQDEVQNLAICVGFAKRISEASLEEKEIFFRNLRISVFVVSNRQKAYESAIGGAYGCIVYVDKYQQIAMDFVERYPLAKFMDERHVNYQTSLVHKDVNIKVFLFGFGDTNKEIFLASIANNQFLCEGKETPELKQVCYYIFDKSNGVDEGSYYRYARELASYNPNEYLALPALPAKEEYFQLAVEEEETLDTMQSLLGGVKDVHFAVVDFGTDEENIAFAQKLLKKQKGWQTDTLIVFVKAKTIRKEDTAIDQENCLFIGNEEDCVFNLKEILGDRIYQMSQLRNAIYNLEYDLTSGNATLTEEYVRQNRENAVKDWFTAKSQIERDSSTYGCLSLRSKLNLMGLDYCGKNENDLPALTEEEYLALYAAGDMPDLTTYHLKADGKPIVYYTLDFPNSRRKTMAIHEHYRWNAFMFSKGMVPATRQQILGEQVEKNGKLRYTNGKNYEEHRHGNLTTFEGLIEFRQMVANRDGCDETERDVIKYDYQLLDDAYWLLHKSGCKIIYKE